MTKGEFTGQFIRLCAGFRLDATAEQAEAWFRRIGHVALDVWAESVTTLLCAERFPRDLDAVMKILDSQASAMRAKAILKEKASAPQIQQVVERNVEEWKRKAGVQAYRPQCNICGGDVHGDRLCWPWLDEAEREQRMRIPYWQARRRQDVKGAA